MRPQLFVPTFLRFKFLIVLGFLLQAAAGSTWNLEQIKKSLTSSPVLDGNVGFSPAWQVDSPVIVMAVDVGVEGEGEKTTFVLNHAVLKNLKDVPIKEYRLGWVVIYSDAQKKPDVHFGTLLTLQPAIGANAVSEVRDKLAPSIALRDQIKFVSFFVMDAKLEDGTVFHQDAERMASDQYERVWPKKKN